MPPEQNPNNNIPNTNTLKIGIDPVFKSNPNLQTSTPQQQAPATAYNVLSAQQYTPSQNTPIVPLKPEVTSNAPKSIIRTYKGDIESAISTDHISSVNIALAENLKLRSQIQSGEKPAPEERAPASTAEYSKSKIIIFFSVILVILGIGSVSLIYLLKGSGGAETVQVQTLPSLITTEFKDELYVNALPKGTIAQALSVKLNDSQITVNNLYNTYITTGSSTGKRLVSSVEFVNLMGFKMPDLLKRTLLPDFMVGTYSFGKNLPFVILKTSYFENAYAGMLSWENDLEKDFQVLFRLTGYQTAGGILAELTPTTIKKFSDSVIVNKDVRILKDETGQIMLLYGIIDKETIIITVNDVAFKEILTRLNNEKTLKR